MVLNSLPGVVGTRLERAPASLAGAGAPRVTEFELSRWNAGARKTCLLRYGIGDAHRNLISPLFNDDV